MKKNQLTIGRLIEKEVLRQQIDRTEFARMINTTRSNVYHMFERNDFKIEHLLEISEALHHNFFADIAQDLNLAKPIDLDEQELTRIRSVSQFLDCVPKIFEEMGLGVSIMTFNRVELDNDIPMVDYLLPQFNITFTVGQNYEERCNGFWGNGVMFYTIQDRPANMVGYMKITDALQYLDIAIDLKTEEEWRQTILFAMDEIQSFFLPKTWEYLKNLER